MDEARGYGVQNTTTGLALGPGRGMLNPLASAVRAEHLEEGWPAGEVEDGERSRRRIREPAETKRVRPGTWRKG